MEFVSCFTELALASISFPNFKFNGFGDESSALRIHMYWLCKVLVPFDCYEFKLVHNSVLIFFLPCIDEMKHTVV